jgi:hypothetical protein
MPTFPLTGSAAEAYLAPPAQEDLADPAGLEGEGWALEWALPDGAEDGEQPLEHDGPVLTQAISDAIESKDWPRVLEIALQVGWHDENRLTNLLFFGRHPELDRRPLDPKHNAKDRALAEEWTRVLRTEVRPAVQRAAEDRSLEVSGALVTERDPELAGARGARFAAIVTSVAGAVDLDPGFVAAVLLAEVGSATPYLSTGEVQSFFTGTDDFLEQKNQLRANVPAFAQVRFDESRKRVFVNEHGRRVVSVPFRTGRDAALATAVYLKWAQTKLRRAMTKNGGNFDTLPMPTRFVLMRVAMAAGHGAISRDGDLVWHKKSAVVKEGVPGAVLLGVARSVYRVLHGEDILVRNWEPRKDPTSDSHITHRNATILAAQAAHLGDWFFRAPTLGVQPELGSWLSGLA